MAESKEDNPESRQESVPISGLTAEMLMGQSKSHSDELVKFSELDEPEKDKNKLFLICNHCKCKVMRPGYGSLVEKEIFLPDMTSKYEIGTQPAGDTLTRFWLVKDMFHFENVGFSKPVNETEKYLICADCEIGPIGWHDTKSSKEFFVSAERVVYGSV